MLLEVKELTKRFGGVVANNKVNLRIDNGEIVGLIGPNGAGKSTLFQTILGFYPPTEGTVIFNGKDITGLSPMNVCREGIACTFQRAQSFPQLDVFESVLIGAYCRHTRKKQASVTALDIIEFVGLAGKEFFPLTRLNMFDRKRVELACAMATQPKLLFLDELFAGLVPNEVTEMVELISRVNSERGITLLIVEHVLKVVMSICKRVYVLDYGNLIMEGTPEEVTSDPEVIRAYLGDDYDASEN